MAKLINLTLSKWVFILVFCLSFSTFGKVEPTLAEESLRNVWIRWAKIMAQAQAVEREAWWVLTDQKSKSKPGSFSRLLRALEKKNPNLKKNKVLSCEKFEIRGDVLDPVGSIMKGRLYESCRKPAVHILDFESTTANSLRMTIYPEFQGDVYGLGATIFNKKIDCDLAWNEKEILTKLTFKSYKRNRNEKEIVELETFEYQKDAKNLLTLKGQITENLVAIRKIETQVPLEGTITVNEIELDLPVPPGYIKPAQIPKNVILPISSPQIPAVQAPGNARYDPRGVPADITPQQQVGKDVDPGLKEFSPPVHSDSVRPEALVPVTPPGLPAETTGEPPIFIKQSDPDMVESSDKPTGR